MLLKHYKGDLYRLLGHSTHTETEEILANYMSVKTGQLWSRPAAMFYGFVELDNGEKVQRFKEVKEDEVSYL